MNNIWQLQDAKSKFSELVEMTLVHGVQIVTRRGRKTVVVIPYEEYERLIKPTDSLVEFLKNSPLPDSGLILERDRRGPRRIEIEP